MNIVFMIGNGFDLNVGLRTRFKDVLDDYINVKNDNPRIVKFKDDIKNDIEFWSDFEKRLGEYTKCFSKDNIDEYIDCVRDFRNFLYYYLKKEELRVNYKNFSIKSNVLEFRQSIRNCYKYLPEGEREKVESLFNNSKTNSPKVDIIEFNYTSVFDVCYSLIWEEAEDLKTITQFSEKELNVFCKKERHIHGSLSEHIIIGVDNQSQILNAIFAENQKIKQTIIKPFVNEKLKYERDKKNLTLIDCSDIICVFGMSIGETDSIWWKRIINWLRVDPLHQLIVFTKDNNFNPRNPEEIIEINQSIIRKLFDVVKINSEFDKSTNQIHVGINTDMFKITLATPPV